MCSRDYERGYFLPGTSSADRERELSRRGLLALCSGIAINLVLNTANMNQSVARKVMGFGRGLHPIAHNDGSVSYEPTAETIRRADEMGRYYKANLGRIAMLQSFSLT